MQMPMPQNMLESEMIGAIKIKDGLFIGDELASTVSLQSVGIEKHRYQLIVPNYALRFYHHVLTLVATGLGIRRCQ